MSCEHDCPRPPRFPAVIHNRPALPRIDYRIGSYASFREHMLAQLDQADALAGWTHRKADDPGIALLESAAVAAEILAFYQSLYANEAWLRTAEWRESVAKLVALTGYRLAPALSGEAVFALAVKGDEAVTVPAGFGIKATLADADDAAVFESTAAATAWPHLGQFALYTPRNPPAAIDAGISTLELATAGGDASLAAREAVDLRPGERVMLVPDSSMYDRGGGSFSFADRQDAAEILVVREVTTTLDRVVVTFEGKLGLARGTAIRAFRVDRTFRHFGHDAPRQVTRINETTGRAETEPTDFDRDILGFHSAGGDTDFYSDIQRDDMPLDREVDDLAVGGLLICQGLVDIPSAGNDLPFAVVREIESLAPDTPVWGGKSSPCTVATLTRQIIDNLSITGETADIRHIRFHEVTSPELSLQAPTTWPGGGFGLDTALVYFGSYDEAGALAGRELLLAEEDSGLMQTVKVQTVPDETALAGRDREGDWPWTVTLDQPPRFDREAFSEKDNGVTVYGNLLHADEGETQAQAVLGSGDNRQLFQTFALPKNPLSHHLDPAATPPQVPALEVRVDGVLWQRRDVLFGAGADEPVYVVREDDDGNAFLQFGDGATGARLPSGSGNVVATWRKGAGARGPLAEDQKPKATGKLKPLDEVFMPEPATGGAERETVDDAREAAPARMQSLGRLVGLADYEAEARALPGVRKARADWVAPSGVPRIRLTVLTEGGSETEAAAVAEAMATAARERGASRFPVETVPGRRRWVALDLTVAYESALLESDIEAAVLAALGVLEEGAEEAPETGLFAIPGRRFGQGAHVSQVLGAAQNVPGVTWVRVDGFDVIPLASPPSADPSAVAMPEPLLRREAIGCEPTEVLVMADLHLRLSPVADTGAPGEDL